MSKSSKRKNDEKGICIQLDLSHTNNLLDMDPQRITLGDYTKGEYGGTVPINYNNGPLKFLLSDPNAKDLEKYEMDTLRSSHFLTSRYGIGRFEANDSGSGLQKQQQDRYTVGLSLYGNSGPSDYHNAVVQKLDAIRERVCGLLQLRPQLFRKPSIEIAFVRNAIPCIYDYPKKDVNGTRIPDENSPNRTLHMKILHYPPKDGRALSVRDFRSKLYDLGNAGTLFRRKRSAMGGLQESMPVDSDGQLRFNSALGVHACIVDISSLYITQGAQFYWRKGVDKLFFQEMETHMAIYIVRGLEAEASGSESDEDETGQAVAVL